MRIRRTEQYGFSLVTAIFLLVVLSLLGAMMVTFFTGQQRGIALDVTGACAYQAARAGIEWSAFQVEQSAVSGNAFAVACQSNNPALPQPPALAGTLAGFSVQVGCGAASSVEASRIIWIYSITSTATYGTAVGQPDFVQRVMSVRIEQ